MWFLLLLFLCSPGALWAQKSEKATALTCPLLQEGDLTWPETKAGKTTYPEEFCFQTDAFPPSRTCELVEDEPKWSDVDATCEMQNYSSITPDLLDAMQWTYDLPLYKISQQTSLLNSLDVYILYTAYVSLMDRDVRDVYNLPIAMDNLMRMSRSDLEQAQVKMLATDRWLQLLSDGMLYIARDFLYLDMGPQVVQVTVSQSLVPGLVRHQNGSVTYLSYSENNYFDILQNADCRSAVFVNQTLTHKIDLIHFKDDRFFVQTEQAENVTEVFAMLNSEEVSETLVFRRVDDDLASFHAKCAYWNMNLEGHEYGFWDTDGELSIVFPYFICSFRRTGYFAVIVTPIEERGSNSTDL